MVKRKRMRAILIPVFLYAVSAAVVGYFLFHAQNGARGLEAKREYKRQIFEKAIELEALKAEHAEWDRRTALVREGKIDADILEEEARKTLGHVHANDVIVFLGSHGAH
ncbi:cell division protein FtsB [Pseudochelatococcus lubricantis]|uniref:Cell division protein FtsB n=1 Tax=Pseudochelatococcus lubricantis TaxID=1538102 RepID=A0ABX0UZ64_9HYPH|nr:septum formation initiator family protein [Pseudochelatococcus lubricantis]NIJ58222.1 cell division protein FtsB [Pseudochelatococcus lubricantis]